jgi:hypothetical protein
MLTLFLRNENTPRELWYHISYDRGNQSGGRYSFLTRYLFKCIKGEPVHDVLPIIIVN